MSKTTSTIFQRVNRPDMRIIYYIDSVAIQQINEKGDIELDELYLDNDEIRKILRVINKNKRENLTNKIK